MKATRQVPLTALLQSAQYLPNLERGIQGWLVNQIEVYKKMNPQLIYIHILIHALLCEVTLNSICKCFVFFSTRICV